jgi:glycosyltransferase involved in cell wall biosynthesis
MMGPLLDWALAIANRARTPDDRVFYLGSKDLPNAGPERLPQGLRDAILSQPNVRVITFAGNFGEFYNPEIIVRAARRLQNTGSKPNDYVFVLAGDGPYFRGVAEASAGMANVILPGWLGPDAVAALLRSSHLFVIPCTKAIPAFPNKAFAYLSAGAPVVSSVYGEFREIIEHSEIGANFEPGDDEMLASKIAGILGNEERRSRMGRAARQLYDEKFSADIIYRQFAGFLEKLADHHSRRDSIAPVPGTSGVAAPLASG